jgi:hypothetical protein
VIDVVSNNNVSHKGTDGSSKVERVERRCGKFTGSLAESIAMTHNFPELNHAQETVIMLMIEDGLPDRPHRDQFFSSTYKYLGCSSRLNEETNMIYTVIDLLSENLPTLNEQSNKVISAHTGKGKAELPNHKSVSPLVVKGKDSVPVKEKIEDKVDPHFQGNKLSVISDQEILRYTN